MQSGDLEVVQAAVAWLEAGHAVALATVALTFGSAPRPVGSQMVLRADGRVAGSVSGGCIEDELMARVREGGLHDARPQVIEYGGTVAESRRWGLPCGGRVTVVLERLENPDSLRPVASAIAGRQLLARHLCLTTGEASLLPARSSESTRYEHDTLVRLYGPAWRLLVIGAGQLSRFLAEMALALDYEVIICDPRDEYAASWSVAGATLDTRMPDDAVRDLIRDARCAVVTATHDPRLDDLALLDAFETPAFYIGALGSAATNARRRERLAGLGASREALQRLRGPVGLPLGGRTPAEIAVAVLAHLIAVRAGREWPPPKTAGP